ncbi:uncharacterized protein LOC124826604 [Vigna umbellata]|uniref:uncharacterized protein LOC124826604 n=1 Tax=Vigna umbellata TaxID=87088 RepID=UPI001F5F41CC|nr:uncharacterized protein LOC124826604 [Vigna umbellata]
MQTLMPEKTPPVVDKYDGSTDPDDHIRTFVNAMAFYTISNLVMCRAFSLSLKEEALSWYNTLPLNIVYCFATMQSLFERKYASSRIQERTPAKLVNTKQEKGESLRAFMKRYNETTMQVKDINHIFIIRNLPLCLRAGYFSENLYARLPKTIDELQERVAEFIRIEDIRCTRKKQQQETSANGNKKEGKRSFNNNNKNGGPPQRDSIRALRYDHYTILNAPRTKVLEESLDTELLIVQKKHMPKNAYERKTCRFHLNRGHTIEECDELQDEIERLVRAGHLQKYVEKEREIEQEALREKSQHRSPERSYQRHYRSRNRSHEHDRSVSGHINTISGGFARGGSSSSARRRQLRNLKTVHTVKRKPQSWPSITFTDVDFHVHDPD